MVEMLQYKKFQFGKDRKRMSYFDQQHWNGGVMWDVYLVAFSDTLWLAEVVIMIWKNNTV